MMIAAFDVCYLADQCASAAAVLFSDYRDAEPFAVYTQFIPRAADYLPGEFYKRELPCLLALLERMDKVPDEMVIDGYVMLGERPGLGRHLFECFDGKIPVLGVAKSKFRGSLGAELFRGRSLRPLYITAAGMEQREACERIKRMHGDHRLPTLLRRVDHLARENARQGRRS